MSAIIILCCTIDVGVGFEKSEYSLDEGTSQSVCVTFSRQLQRPISLSSDFEDLRGLLRGETEVYFTTPPKKCLYIIFRSHLSVFAYCCYVLYFWQRALLNASGYVHCIVIYKEMHM